MKGLAQRFAGDDGHRRLVEAWSRQAIVNGDTPLADSLARASKVQTFAAKAEIITQGDEDNDFFLVLVGAVQIERNGRPGPTRSAGNHFGEMALIDVHERRSATVRATEQTVVARVSEADFTQVAEAHPNLWRCLAVEIARRLRQRLADVPRKNERPFVFIGSSREALPIAEAIKTGIASKHVEVKVWTDGVFAASEASIESLEGTVREADVAVLVLTPDDTARSRGKSQRAPRDNVVFELGLFMGALSRGRTFVVRPRADIKIPTDLLGVTPLYYDEGDDVAAACEQLNAAIERLGPK